MFLFSSLLFSSICLYSQTGTWYQNNQTKTASDVLIGTLAKTPSSLVHLYQSYNCGPGEENYLTHRQITFELEPTIPANISPTCPRNKFDIGLNKKELYFYSQSSSPFTSKYAPLFIDSEKGAGFNDKFYLGNTNYSNVLFETVDFTDVSKKSYVFVVNDHKRITNPYDYFTNSFAILPIDETGHEIKGKGIYFFKDYYNGKIDKFNLYVNGDINTTEQINIGKIEDDYDENFSFELEKEYLEKIDEYSYKLNIVRNGSSPTEIISFRENGKVEIGDFDDESNQIWQDIIFETSQNVMDNKYKLAVEGSVMAKQVWVTQYNWPDHVFNKNYKLLPIPALKDFLNTNKHLPGIPSATEINKGIFSLGDMDARLLKKIEELTLYTIQQEEKIKELQNNQNDSGFVKHAIVNGVSILLILLSFIIYRKIKS